LLGATVTALAVTAKYLQQKNNPDHQPKPKYNLWGSLISQLLCYYHMCTFFDFLADTISKERRRKKICKLLRSAMSRVQLRNVLKLRKTLHKTNRKQIKRIGIGELDKI